MPGVGDEQHREVALDDQPLEVRVHKVDAQSFPSGLSRRGLVSDAASGWRSSGLRRRKI
jgi:hypothetical protein